MQRFKLDRVPQWLYALVKRHIGEAVEVALREAGVPGPIEKRDVLTISGAHRVFDPTPSEQTADLNDPEGVTDDLGKQS